MGHARLCLPAWTRGSRMAAMLSMHVHRPLAAHAFIQRHGRGMRCTAPQVDKPEVRLRRTITANDDKFTLDKKAIP